MRLFFEVSKNKLGLVALCFALAGCGGGSDHRTTLDSSAVLPLGLATAKPAMPADPHPSVVRFLASSSLSARNYVGQRQVSGVSIDELFGFAERTYPDLFPSAAETKQFEQYAYRFYPQTGLFLAIDNLENKVWLYQPSVDPNSFIDLGPAGNYSGLVQQWLQDSGADLDTFISGLRNGLSNALDLVELRVQQGDERLARIAFDETDGGLRLLGDVLSACDIDERTELLECSGESYTARGPGAYDLRVVDGAYVVTGTINGSYTSAGQLSAVVVAERRHSGTLINQFRLRIEGTGITDDTRAISVTVPEFVISAVEPTSNRPRSVELNLSGLRIEGSEQDARASLDIPFSLRSSDGDQLQVQLQNAQLRRLVDNRGEDWWTPINLQLGVSLRDPQGQLVTLELKAELKNLGAGFVPWLNESSSNFPSVTFSGAATLPNSGSMLFEVKTLNATNASLGLTLAQAGRTMEMTAALTRRTVNNEFSLGPQGLIVDMVGSPFTAVIKENANGDAEGEVFEGGRKIGVVTSKGMIQVRGREISVF